MEQGAGQTDELREAEPAGAVRGGGARGERARGRFESERVWVLVACTLLAASATLLYLERRNAAFVLAALGASAWFLNVRNRLKRKHDLVKQGGRNWVPREREGDRED